MPIFATALTGAMIALSFSAPPGPVTMETIRRGMRGGFGPALGVQLGSIIGDVMWCALALLGLAPLVQIVWVRWVLAVAGVGVLLYLGGVGIRDALRTKADQASTAVAPKHGAFRSGLAISVANPMAVAYWLGVGGALATTGVIGATAIQTASFVTGFVTGTFVWALLVAAAIRWGRQVMTPAVFRAVTLVCGLVLIGFGLTLATQMLGI
jgi:chemosensory pili system protein ChpE